MKKKKVVLTVVAVVLVICLIIAAIVLLKKDTFGMTRTERNKPVAVVGGTETITANEFAVDFNNYYSNVDSYNMAYIYGYGGSYHDVSTPEGVEALKKEIFDGMVEERAIICIAAEKGITLTAEEKEQAAKTGREAYDNLVNSYAESYKSYGYSDPKSQAVSGVGEYISKTGIGTKTEYVRRATHSAEASLLQEKVFAKLGEESGITAENAAEYYPDWAKMYQENYTEGYIAYYDEAFIAGEIQNRFLYIPEEGFVFVRVIKLTDGARAEAIVADIGTDAAKFETYCMSEENQDGLMPLIAADDAYAISAADSSFDASVYEAAAAMNVGDIKLVVVDNKADEEEPAAEEAAEPAAEEAAAEPAAEEAAAEPAAEYYIIRRVEGATGIVPFEKVKDKVTDDVVEYAKEEYAEKAVHEWIEKEGNVKIDESVYEMIEAKAA